MVTPREEAAGGDRHGSPLAVSNIAESICPAIPGERQLEHSSEKNARISSSQSFAADSVSFQVWSTPAGHVRTPRDNL